MKSDFKPSRSACYSRLFLASATAWGIAIFRPRLPRGLFDNLGWWLVPVIILAAVGAFVVAIAAFGFLAWLGKWEGPITNFIHSDVEWISGKTPFPTFFKKALYGVIITLILPLILLLIPSGD